ncbi:MAG: siderophore-interacting protein [Nocardioidaceae bacterium]|nr:siderophore-interacting protein [Nocardioidaceae bacterium]
MTTTEVLPYLLAEVEAVEVERISPSFVRVVLAGPELAGYGVDGPRYDQRIKLVFGEGGPMRTYTIADVLGEGEETRLVVDIVVHEDGLAGPGGSWGLAARPGDRVIVPVPRRGVPFGGIEYDAPADTRRVLLVGDETALPAIASILTDVAPQTRGHVFVEVPEALDIRDLVAPAGVELCWLARGHGDPGSRLVPAVRAHLGLKAGLEPGEWADPAEVDPDLWETPTYSSSGATLEADQVGDDGHDLDGLYAWIAGESRMVTTLRRALVDELAVERARVAFMGYWRQGVAMRS